MFLIFVDNWESKYLEKDEVSPGVKAGAYQGEVRSDISTSFFILLAIFFPSVTGTVATVNVELNCYLHSGLAQLWKIVLGFFNPIVHDRLSDPSINFAVSNLHAALPISVSSMSLSCYAWLALLVERRTALRKVEGSSPRPNQHSGS